MGEARTNVERLFGLALLNENKDNASSSGAYAIGHEYDCDGAAAVAFQRFRICTGTPTRVMPFISCRFPSLQRAGPARRENEKERQKASVYRLLTALPTRSPARLHSSNINRAPAQVRVSLDPCYGTTSPGLLIPRRDGSETFLIPEISSANPSYFSPTFLRAPVHV